MRARTSPPPHSNPPLTQPLAQPCNPIHSCQIAHVSTTLNQANDPLQNLPEIVAFLQLQNLSGNFSQIRNNWHCSHYILSKYIRSSTPARLKYPPNMLGVKESAEQMSDPLIILLAVLDY